MGYMKDVMGVTNVGIIGIDDPGAITVSNADAATAKQLGLTVGYEANVPISQTDWTADVAKMKAAGVNGVVVYTSPAAALSLVPAAKQAGLNAKFLLSTGYDPRLLLPALDGVTDETAYAPFEYNLPAQQPVKAAFAKIGVPAGIPEVNNWLSADLFVKGLSVAGGCPTRDSFINGLRQVHDFDGSGLLPPIDEATALTHGDACFYHVTEQNKMYTPVEQAGHPYCGKQVTLP
jgi:branched-chain amino acid transport system substrate-binding protein